jgi:hypothetical protein
VADADPLAPADPLNAGAAHVTRLGGTAGQLALASAIAVPGATLAVASCAQALAGQVVQVNVTLNTLVRAVSPALAQLVPMHSPSQFCASALRHRMMRCERPSASCSSEQSQPRRVSGRRCCSRSCCCATRRLAAWSRCLGRCPFRTCSPASAPRAACGHAGHSRVPHSLSPRSSRAPRTAVLRGLRRQPRCGAPSSRRLSRALCV